MEAIMGRCYFDALAAPPWQGQGRERGFAEQETRWSQGLNMRKMTLTAIAVLAISVGYGEAKDGGVETDTRGRPANTKTVPVCTSSSSLFEVLGDKCFLVKGSKIYGDIAGLSQIITVSW
jgi:hypothetical protein